MNIKLPDSVKAGDRIEVCVAPKGEYPQIVDGKEVNQIVDAAALESLVDNFNSDLDEDGNVKKVLVDRDHDSEEGRGTEAMAWIDELKVDPEKGLVATFEFTDSGADAVNNKRYRFTSCAWTLDADGRPDKLSTVAFTNRPNLPVPPMLNSKAAKGASGTVVVCNDLGVTTDNPNAPVEDAAESGVAEPGPGDSEKTKTETPKGISMNINEKLGLPAEATDEEVEAALDALIARANEMDEVENALGFEDGTLKNDADEPVTAAQAINALIAKCENDDKELADIRQAQNEAAADEFVSENADDELFATPEEKEELKNEFLADPEAAKATVANARKMRDRIVANAKAKTAVASKTVVNARVAKRPVATNAVKDGMSACKSAEEQNEYIRKNIAGLV